MITGIAPWAVTGAVTGVAAPTLLLAARRQGVGRVPELPGALCGPAFVLLHGAITLSLTGGLGVASWAVLHAILLLGAALYWRPVLGPGRRLDGAERFLYLFLTSPLLDLAGVAVVALGHPDEGLAMIVGMLPLNVGSVIVTWQWITEEESLVVGEESDAERR